MKISESESRGSWKYSGRKSSAVRADRQAGSDRLRLESAKTVRTLLDRLVEKGALERGSRESPLSFTSH